MWPCDPHIPRPAPRPQAGNPVPGRTVPPTPPNVHCDCVYTYTQVWPGSENIYPYIWERVPSWRPILSGARRAHHHPGLKTVSRHAPIPTHTLDLAAPRSTGLPIRVMPTLKERTQLGKQALLSVNISCCCMFGTVTVYLRGEPNAHGKDAGRVGTAEAANRDRSIAAAVIMCCRCALASPMERPRRRPKPRTPSESVPSIPARTASSSFHSAVSCGRRDAQCYGGLCGLSPVHAPSPPAAPPCCPRWTRYR